MRKPLNPEDLFPSFRGFRSFRPILENEEEPPVDPLLKPEEQGAIKRYLRYADTLLKSDETPEDNERVREVSMLRSRRGTDKRVA